MKLDIQSRILPKGYLVNKDGQIARKGTTLHYYCGRKIKGVLPFGEGYCGPSNGPACNPCKILNEQAKTRYRALIEWYSFIS